MESVEESGIVIQKVQTLGSEQVEREKREGGRSRSYNTYVHVHVQSRVYNILLVQCTVCVCEE